MGMHALQQKQQTVAIAQAQEAAQKLAQQKKQLAEDNATLLTLNNGGGGVLPVTYINGVKYVLLGRESRNDKYGRGQGTWDSFAGGAKKGETTLWQTAGREGWEEMNALSILGFDLSKMTNYIDAKADNTEAVIALRLNKEKELYYALYLTKFSEAQINTLLSLFGKQGYNQDDEKDQIALVAWEELVRVIKPTAYSRATENDTLEVHTRAGNSIRLRPIVVKVLRPYIQRDADKQGPYNKIHTYTRW